MEKQNLSSLIWSTADDVLRGMFKPSEYGRIILPFVVLRRLDCVLEPQKDKAFELHEKYKKKLKDLDYTELYNQMEDILDYNKNKCFELMENDEFIPNELIKLYENKN